MRLSITLDEALQKASPILRAKMEHSVELLRKAERLALMYDGGYYGAFSGGKDSQALYHITELSGVKGGWHFSPTSVDPPALIRFIRHNYPDVEFAKLRKSIYDVAVEKQILPTQKVRWCCAEFKESAGAGKVTLIGIRHEESIRRAKRNEVEISSRKFSGSFEQFMGYREDVIRKKYKNLNFDQFAEHKEQMVSCINGKDSILVSPIIEWTARDVWEFLNNVCEVPHCELYDNGYHRIGCIMCPMASHKQKMRECKEYPYVKAKWIEAIKKIRMGGISVRTYTPASDRTQNPLRGGQKWGYIKASDSGFWRPEGGTERRSTALSQNGIREQVRKGFLREGGVLDSLSESDTRRISSTERPSGLSLTMEETIPNNADLENEIAENIFDWWISGKSYEDWYADKFQQGRLDLQ